MSVRIESASIWRSKRNSIRRTGVIYLSNRGPMLGSATMPLEAAVELLAHARRHCYAVGYFESWDVASLEGVIDAAEQSQVADHRGL